MPCRVGISTNPDERREYWERKVVGLTQWQIIGEHRSRERAQEHETEHALKNGCEYSPGGQDAIGMWYVYRFTYTRTRS